MTSGDATPAIVAQAGPSATDREAVGDAARVAAERDAVLHLVCAYQPSTAAAREHARRRLPTGLRLDCEDERVAEAQAILEDARDGLPRDLVVRLHQERGDGVEALCRVARSERADLIFLAPPTGGFAGRAARRRVARMLAQAPCPVRLTDGAPGSMLPQDLGDPAAASPSWSPPRPEFAAAGILLAADCARPPASGSTL